MKSFQTIKPINKQEHNFKSFLEKNPSIHVPSTFVDSKVANNDEKEQFDIYELTKQFNELYGVKRQAFEIQDYEFFYSLRFFPQIGPLTRDKYLIALAEFGADCKDHYGRVCNTSSKEIKINILNRSGHALPKLLHDEYIRKELHHHGHLKPAFDALLDEVEIKSRKAYLADLKSEVEQQEEEEMFDFRKYVKDSDRTKSQISELEKAITEKEDGVKMTPRRALNIIGKKFFSYLPTIAFYTFLGLYGTYLTLCLISHYPISFGIFFDFVLSQSLKGYISAYTLGLIGYYATIIFMPPTLAHEITKLREKLKF